jgi:hypothetical protein
MASFKPDRFGGALFLTAGICFGLSTALFFFIDVLHVRELFRVAYVLLALFFLAGLGCPSVLSGQTSSRSSFDRWIDTLATVGLAVGLIDSVRTSYIGTLVLPWPEGIPTLLKRTDPLGIIVFPAIGLWVLVSSLKLRQLGPSWRKLGNAGLACGSLLFAPPVTETLGTLGWKYIMPVFGAVALLMSVMILFWFGGVGFLLSRNRPS